MVVSAVFAEQADACANFFFVMGLTAPLMYGLGQAMGRACAGLTLVNSSCTGVCGGADLFRLVCLRPEQQVVVERDKRKQMGGYHLNRCW